MGSYANELKQFLSEEKELLTGLAFDVANAETPYEYKKAKSLYDAQFARVGAIQDSYELALRDDA